MKVRQRNFLFPGVFHVSDRTTSDFDNTFSTELGCNDLENLVRGKRKECMRVLGPVWHSSASPVELFFRKQLHEQLHEWGREPCFGSFTMCLTL
jgi:hypothetical protein